MSMSDPGPQMKPQDTTIFLLGEIKGTLGALQSSVATNTQAQAAVNAENKREHDEFRTAISELRTAQPPKVSVWSKLAVLIGVPGAAGAAIALVLVLTK